VFLFPERADALGSPCELWLKLLVLIVEAGEGLAVEDAVVPTVVDPGVVIDTHDVSRLITRLGESGEGKESPCDSIRWELMCGGTLEPNHALGLLLAVGNVVGVVADMLLRGIGQALVARSLIGNTLRTLEEGCLAALSYGVDAVLVEAPGGGDGGVVVHPLATVHGPVVVAVVVNAAVTVIHQPILTYLLSQGAVCTLVELVAVSLVWIGLEPIRLGAS